MMNNKKRLIIICLFVLAIFSSCDKVIEKIPKVIKKIPEQTIYANITRGSNYKDFIQGSRNYMEFEALSTEKITYYFELNKYNEEQVNNFITNVENLRLSFESEFKILFEKSLTIFISESITFGTEDGKIFFNKLDIDTIDATTVFLQALFGDTINYGLAYGIACHINENLYKDSTRPSASLKELKEYYSTDKNLTLMDLTIPVFQTIYFSEKENNYSYSSAYYFVKDIIERKGLDYAIAMLKDSTKLETDFDVKYTDEKNIWLESIAATQRYEAPIIPIRYKLSLKRNAKTYPYVLHTPSTISYITPNENFYYENIIMTYNYVKRFLTMYEQDVTALRDYLSPYIDTDKSIINCTFKHKDDGMSYFHGEGEGITYSSPLYAGAHEYAHYLTSKHDINLPVWMIEGIADYCANYLESKGVYRMKEEHNSKYNLSGTRYYYDKNIAAGNDYIENSFLLFHNELQAYNNSKITGDDKNTISSVYYNAAYIENKDERSLSYSEAASLVNYLIKSYGEEKFFELYNDYSKLTEIYGKTFSELKQEWLDKLQTSLIFD